jgi:small subunit ribosomal protein S18
MADERGGGRSYGGRGGDSSGRGDSRGGFKSRRPKRKVCPLCLDKVMYLDYKDVAKVRRFISEKGKILPRRMTGTCAKHQRAVTTAVKRARHIALLPFVQD